MKHLAVYEPGTVVLVGEPGSEIKATVIQVAIRAAGDIQYQLSWWDGNNRKSAWLEEWEVLASADKSTKTKIGFRS